MAYTHIIAPLDLSPHSEQALRHAFQEARAHHAKVTLLHVLHHHPDTEEYYLTGSPETESGIQGSMIAFPRGFDPDTGGRLPTSPSSPSHVVRRDYLEEAHNQLRDLISGNSESDWNTEVISGNPGDAIIDYAKEHGGDLIVMGTHGRTGLRHLLMGSVAEHVVRHAPCPILIVRSVEEKR
jgi:nucleotide-binding universal stress UspA family protein